MARKRTSRRTRVRESRWVVLHLFQVPAPEGRTTRSPALAQLPLLILLLIPILFRRPLLAKAVVYRGAASLERLHLEAARRTLPALAHSEGSVRPSRPHKSAQKSFLVAKLMRTTTMRPCRPSWTSLHRPLALPSPWSTLQPLSLLLNAHTMVDRTALLPSLVQPPVLVLPRPTRRVMRRRNARGHPVRMRVQRGRASRF